MNIYIITYTVDGTTSVQPFTTPSKINLHGDFNMESCSHDPEGEAELFRVMEAAGLEAGWNSDLDSVSIHRIDTKNIPHIFL